MAKKKFKIKTEAELRKKYGKNSNTAKLKEKGLWLPSEIISVNQATGGGILYGRILELFGQESSGKSLLAFNFAKVTQSLGGQVLWVDAERCFDEEWAGRLGVEADDVELLESSTIEEIGDWVKDYIFHYRLQLVSNEPILLVLDSVAALDSQLAHETEFSDQKAEMGTRAKAIYKMLRINNDAFADLGISVILINQLRAKVGASLYEDPDTTPGGKALAFYASIRLGVYGGKMIKERIKGVDKKVGRVGSLRIKKNKIAPPADSMKYEMYNNPKGSNEIGFNRYFGLLDVMLEEEIVYKKSKGASQIYFKDEMVAKGKDNFDEVIRENAELRKKLLRRLGVNTPGKLRKVLDKLDENLFTIDV